MEVTGSFTFKDGTKSIDGKSLWDQNLSYKVGDIVACENKQWKVIAVSKIFQGCFAKPTWRRHAIKLEPIDHNDLPIVGNILVKIS